METMGTVEELFDREYDRLVGALGVAFDPEAAADAVQEAFIEADHRWASVGLESSPLPPDFVTVSGAPLCTPLPVTLRSEPIRITLDWNTGCMRSRASVRPADSDVLPDREPHAEGVLFDNFRRQGLQLRVFGDVAGAYLYANARLGIREDTVVVDGTDGSQIGVADLRPGQRVQVWMFGGGGCGESAPPSCSAMAIRTLP